MPDVNLWAVLACGVGSLVLGGLWYSPLLFGNRWQKLAGLNDEQMAGGNAKIFGLTVVLSMVAAYVFAVFLGPDMGLGPSIAAGASAGLCWVAAALGINYLFERKPLNLWLINGGYHTLQFTMFGLILGLLR
ncbi:MAG: DUF1761 domain-containing protein [Sphingomicrobium sp.]